MLNTSIVPFRVISRRSTLSACLLAAMASCAAESSPTGEPSVEYLNPTQRIDVGEVLAGHYVDAVHHPWGLEYELYGPASDSAIAGGDWDFETGSFTIWTELQPDGVTSELPTSGDLDRDSLASEAAFHLAVIWSMTDADDTNDFEAVHALATYGTNRHDPKGTLDDVRVGDYSTRARGWACDLDRPQAPLTLFVFGFNSSNRRLYSGTAKANLVREKAVGDACGGFRAHGFDTSFDGRAVGGVQVLSLDMTSNGISLPNYMFIDRESP